MSRGINKAILVGNLGSDPEVRTLPSGDPVANVSLATGESRTDKSTGEVKERSEWHRVVFFGKLAEIVQQYLHTGSRIYVEGRLRTRQWQTSDGHERYTTEIIVDARGSMQMLDSRPVEASAPTRPEPAPRKVTKPRRQPETDRKFKRLCTPKAASGQEVSEGQRAGQGGTASGADISGVLERAWAGRWGRAGWREIRGGSPLCGRRWRLPGGALIELEIGLGLGLGEEVPVQHRRGSILPRGWSAGGAIGGGSVGSPRTTRIRWTGAVSVSNAAHVLTSTGRERPVAPAGIPRSPQGETACGRSPRDVRFLESSPGCRLGGQ